MKKINLAALILLCTGAANASPELVGSWRSDPSAQAVVGSPPPQLLQIRKSGSNYFIELVEFVPAASKFVVREVPAISKDGGLRYAGRQIGEDFLLYDGEKKVMLGGVCKLPCRHVDTPSYDAGKRAALAWKPKDLADFIPK